MLILGINVNNSFLVSKDGTTQKREGIIAPSDHDGNGGPYAVIEGDLFIFGGANDKRRVGENIKV